MVLGLIVVAACGAIGGGIGYLASQIIEGNVEVEPPAKILEKANESIKKYCEQVEQNMQNIDLELMKRNQHMSEENERRREYNRSYNRSQELHRELLRPNPYLYQSYWLSSY